MADGYHKGMGGGGGGGGRGGGGGGGGGGEGEEGREVNSYISDALVLCRSADLLILLFFLTAVVQRPKTLPSGPKPYKRGLMILLTPFVFRCVIFCR